MITYGIDAGNSNNSLVRLQGRQLRRLSLKAPVRPPEAPDCRPDANRLAAELAGSNITPLGVDAALTLARSPAVARPWESWLRGFKTPSSVEPLPAGGSNQQQHWWRLTRWWTNLAHILVTAHEYTIWAGGDLPANGRLLIEVYPRVSWTSLAAEISHPIKSIYTSGAVAWRDEVLTALELEWTSPKAGTHDRDAAICAVTARQVVRGKAMFFGQEVSDAGTHCAGGGIAIPSSWGLP